MLVHQRVTIHTALCDHPSSSDLLPSAPTLDSKRLRNPEAAYHAGRLMHGAVRVLQDRAAVAPGGWCLIEPPKMVGYTR